MMVVLKNVLKTYDNYFLDINDLVFNNPSLNLIQGQNGSGKTTLLKLIAGINDYEKGQILINNFDIKKTSRWKKYISVFLDSDYLLDFLTKEEYLKFHGNAYDKIYKDFLISNSFFSTIYNSLPEKKLIREYSKGNRAKLGILAVLLSDTDIMLLDEPFANLDKESQIELAHYLNIIKTEKIIILSTHHKEIIFNYCDREVMIANGRIL